MPIAWIDSSESYGTTAANVQRYYTVCGAEAGYPVGATNNGVFGDAYLRLNGNIGGDNPMRLNRTFSHLAASWASAAVLGFQWIKIGATDPVSTAQCIAGFRDFSSAGSNLLVGIGVVVCNTDGKDYFCLMGSAFGVASNGPNVLALHSVGMSPWTAWHRLELSATFAHGTGTAVLYHSGQKVLSFTGSTLASDTRYATGFCLAARGSGAANTEDDFAHIYCLIASGQHNVCALGSTYRTFLYSPVSSVTGAISWTPNTGSGAAAVDDVQGNDGDSTYTSSASAGNRDRYTASAWWSALSANDRVRGVMLFANCRASGGTGSLNLLQELSGTVASGWTSTVSNSTNYGVDVVTTFDTTAVNSTWTVTALNSSTFGYENV